MQAGAGHRAGAGDVACILGGSAAPPAQYSTGPSHTPRPASRPSSAQTTRPARGLRQDRCSQWPPPQSPAAASAAALTALPRKSAPTSALANRSPVPGVAAVDAQPLHHKAFLAAACAIQVPALGQAGDHCLAAQAGKFRPGPRPRPGPAPAGWGGPAKGRPR